MLIRPLSCCLFLSISFHRCSRNKEKIYVHILFYLVPLYLSEKAVAHKKGSKRIMCQFFRMLFFLFFSFLNSSYRCTFALNVYQSFLFSFLSIWYRSSKYSSHRFFHDSNFEFVSIILRINVLYSISCIVLFFKF